MTFRNNDWNAFRAINLRFVAHAKYVPWQVKLFDVGEHFVEGAGRTAKEAIVNAFAVSHVGRKAPRIVAKRLETAFGNSDKWSDIIEILRKD